MDLAQVIALIQEQKFPYHLEGRQPQVLLVGQHHNYDALGFQEILIEVARPQAVLHEDADPYFNFRPETSRILRWGKKYGITISLCDIPSVSAADPSKEGLRFSAERFLPPGMRGRYDLFSKVIEPVREEVMGQTVREHIKRCLLPLMVVVDSRHIRPASGIYDALEDLDYIAIAQNKELAQALRFDAEFFKTQ